MTHFQAEHTDTMHIFLDSEDIMSIVNMDIWKSQKEKMLY